MADFYTGDVVFTTDKWHNNGTLRPHLVIKVLDDNRLWVVPFSHNQQGEWSTDELGGGTYLATCNLRTGARNDFVIDPTSTSCELGRRQLSDNAITSALAEVRRVLQAIVR